MPGSPCSPETAAGGLIAGHGQGGREGNRQRANSRTGQYACMRQRKEEMLSKDKEKDRSWMMIKAVGYLHLS